VDQLSQGSEPSQDALCYKFLTLWDLFAVSQALVEGKECREFEVTAVNAIDAFGSNQAYRMVLLSLLPRWFRRRTVPSHKSCPSQMFLHSLNSPNSSISTVEPTNLAALELTPFVVRVGR
jgi:hypothetical protein